MEVFRYRLATLHGHFLAASSCSSGWLRHLDTGTPNLLAQVDQRGVALVTLNHPSKRNAMGDNITPFLRQLLHELRHDSNVRVLVITGAGKAFSAGGNMMGTDSVALTPPPMPPSPDGWTPNQGDPHGDFKLRQRTVTGAIWLFPKPTIAVLPGAAAGMGASIALACDMRVASEEAFLATAYIDIGLPGDYGGTWTLTQLVGPAKAKELAFTNQRVYGEEGVRLGIFNRLVKSERLLEEALELAASIAEKPPSALYRLKDNINLAASGVDFFTALDHEAVNLREHVESEVGKQEFAMMRTRFQKRSNAKTKTSV